MPDALSSGTSRKFAAWLRQLPQWLKPSSGRCAYCNEATVSSQERLGLCRTCYDSVPWIREVECPTCGRYEACQDCRRRTEQAFSISRSAVRYDKTMKDLLARYKYRGDEKLATLLGAMLSYTYALVQQHRPTPARMPEYLTFVPLSEMRLAERGFNQAEQMARQAGRRLQLPVVELLVRERHTDKQSLKTRSNRIRDLASAFTVREDAPPIPSDQACRIYIVDDVYTTGSTLQQCAAALKAHFPHADVIGLMWAR